MRIKRNKKYREKKSKVLSKNRSVPKNFVYPTLHGTFLLRFDLMNVEQK